MNVPRRILWATMGMAAVAVTTIMALLLWITARTNDIAAAETSKRVRSSVEQLIGQNAKLALDYANWNSAYEWFMTDSVDDLYSEIGSGATDAGSFDMIYLLAPDGTPRYGYLPQADASDHSSFDPALSRLFLPTLAELPMAPYAAVSGLVVHQGKVAIMAAARIQPDETAGLEIGDLPVMFAGVWLDTDDLARVAFLDDLALIDVAADPSADQSRLVLTDFADNPIGALSWQAVRPGHVMLGQVMPIVALLSLTLFGASWVVAGVSARQTAEFLREKVSARTDPVTGLLNRSGLGEIAESAPMRSRIDLGQVALIYLDINGLKVLNDTFGHKVGDAAIKVTAARLKASVRGDDFVARMGGDEFVCLVVDHEPMSTAAQIAERFGDQTTRPFSFGGRTHFASAAIGIALAHAETDWDTLLSQADQAMYQAKRQNLQNAVLFDRGALQAG